MNLLYAWFRKVPCHRKADRCLHVKGEPMPICSRCLFMLIGLFLFPFFLFVTTPFWLLYGVLLQIPMLIDGFTQKWGKRSSNNPLRILTGGMSGIGLAILTASGMQLLILCIEKIIH